MRSFSLSNNLGQIWDLSSLDSWFEVDDGLGFDREIDCEQVGNIFSVKEDIPKQKKITGEIKFSGYQKYEEFVLFAQHKPLVLTYVANSTVHIKVNIKKLKKSEIKDVDLVCDVEFLGLGLFYKIVRVENDATAEVGKTYPYEYPYTYADNTVAEVVINSNTVEESPLTLIVIGPCINPSWTHYVNGIVKTVGKMGSSENIVSIPGGNRLVIDTSTTPWSIKEVDNLNNFVADHYQKSDFSTKRFTFLEYGENKIGLAHEGTGVLKIIAEGMLFYDTL